MAVTGLDRRTHAARGRLERLVVAVAVLAGLGLAIGLQCTNGMAMPAMSVMSPPHGTTSMADDDAAGVADALTALRTGPVTVMGEDTSGPHGLGGVLATCLVFILAVMAAVVALRTHQIRSVARLLRSARVVVIRAGHLRAPSLAELCLLRT